MVNTELTGTKLHEFDFPIERGKIKEFARAILNLDPLYHDPEYARSQGYKDALIPVTFPMSFTHHLNAENFVLEMALALGLDPEKSVHGECEILFERPVCAGETFRGEVTVGKCYEKEGKRGGKMSFVDVEIKFYDQDNKQVFSVTNLHIERS
jgi:acyl dehydratase